jgi:hypothetical protein
MKLFYLLSISRCISFREVALSITASRTESFAPKSGSLLDSPGSLPLPDCRPLAEVCWRMEILVGIGIPGISFSATAFRIADIEYQFAFLNTTLTTAFAELYLYHGGGAEQHSLDFPVPLRPIRA